MVIPFNLPSVEKFTDTELVDFCMANPELRVERDEYGQLYINMSPTFAFSSNLNSEIVGELIIWNRKNKLGKVFESNSAFYLPDSSLKGPDAAFISNENWATLSEQEKMSFPHLVPEFIVELRSKTDNLIELKQKMLKWIENGVLLAWLIDPNTKITTVYDKTSLVSEVPFNEILSGHNVLPGLNVVLADIFEE